MLVCTSFIRRSRSALVLLNSTSARLACSVSSTLTFWCSFRLVWACSSLYCWKDSRITTFSSCRVSLSWRSLRFLLTMFFNRCVETWSEGVNLSEVRVRLRTRRSEKASMPLSEQWLWSRLRSFSVDCPLSERPRKDSPSSVTPQPASSRLTSPWFPSSARASSFVPGSRNLLKESPRNSRAEFSRMASARACTPTSVMPLEAMLTWVRLGCPRRVWLSSSAPGSPRLTCSRCSVVTRQSVARAFSRGAIPLTPILGLLSRISTCRLCFTLCSLLNSRSWPRASPTTGPRPLSEKSTQTMEF
eukprot:RCo030492